MSYFFCNNHSNIQNRNRITEYSPNSRVFVWALICTLQEYNSYQLPWHGLPSLGSSRGQSEPSRPCRLHPASTLVPSCPLWWRSACHRPGCPGQLSRYPWPTVESLKQYCNALAKISLIAMRIDFTNFLSHELDGKWTRQTSQLYFIVKCGLSMYTLSILQRNFKFNFLYQMHIQQTKSMYVCMYVYIYSFTTVVWGQHSQPCCYCRLLHKNAKFVFIEKYHWWSILRNTRNYWEIQPFPLCHNGTQRITLQGSPLTSNMWLSADHIIKTF